MNNNDQQSIFSNDKKSTCCLSNQKKTPSAIKLIGLFCVFSNDNVCRYWIKTKREMRKSLSNATILMQSLASARFFFYPFFNFKSNLDTNDSTEKNRLIIYQVDAHTNKERVTHLTISQSTTKHIWKEANIFSIASIMYVNGDRLKIIICGLANTHTHTFKKEWIFNFHSTFVLPFVFM